MSFNSEWDILKYKKESLFMLAQGHGLVNEI